MIYMQFFWAMTGSSAAPIDLLDNSYGDDMSGTTTTLCVRRATYWDEEMGKEDPAKKGVCSNYLCDAPPGQQLKLTGPSGKVGYSW